MRHLDQNTSPPDKKYLLKRAYLIIDTKIKYLDQKVQDYFVACTNPAKVNTLSSSELEEIRLLDTLDKLLDYVDTLQLEVERLQTLRAWLDEKTVHTVVNLLKDNNYLACTSEEIDQLLKEKSLLLRRLRSNN